MNRETPRYGSTVKTKQSELSLHHYWTPSESFPWQHTNAERAFSFRSALSCSVETRPERWLFCKVFHCTQRFLPPPEVGCAQRADPQLPHRSSCQAITPWNRASSAGWNPAGLSPGGSGEAHAVEGHHHGPADAQVMLQRDLCPGDLPPPGQTAQLPAEFGALRQAWKIEHRA